MKTSAQVSHLTAALLILGTVVPTFADSIRTIALSGDAVVDVPGAALEFTGGAILNDAQQVVFNATFSGFGIDKDSNSGTFVERSDGELTLLARDGLPGPGTGDESFITTSPLFISNSGLISLSGAFTGPSAVSDLGFSYGHWSMHSDGELSLLVRSDGAAAGVDAAVYSWLSDPVFNNLGAYSFSGLLSGEGVTRDTNSGIWYAMPGGEPRLLAREGDQSPGIQQRYFKQLLPPAINQSGQATFFAELGSTVADSETLSSIWIANGDGALSLVALEGEKAPDIGGALIGGTLTRLAANSAGHAAFGSSLAGVAVTDRNDFAIWKSNPGEPYSLVVREGDPAPGTDGARFGRLFSPMISGAGQTAFRGQLAGPGVTNRTDNGFWVEERDGNLRLIVREGDAAPGTEDASFSVIIHPAINDVGQVVFEGWLSGTAVSDANDFGIWAQDEAGVLTLIVREGDQLDVNDDPQEDDYRTVARLSMETNWGPTYGRGGSFNDLGYVVFRATFTDGSQGVFVSSRAAVPEMGSLQLVAIAILAGPHASRRSVYDGRRNG